MQTYPAYYPSQYPYSPMLNPQQRLAQMEQMYPQFSQQNLVGTQMSLPQQPQIIGIQGKIVSDFETVKSTEIPLDGSISYFPTTNREYVYAKSLNLNTGSSEYEIYKRVVEMPQEQKKEEFDIKAYFDEKFEVLEQRLKGGAKNGRKSNGRADNSDIEE